MLYTNAVPVHGNSTVTYGNLDSQSGPVGVTTAAKQPQEVIEANVNFADNLRAAMGIAIPKESMPSQGNTLADVLLAMADRLRESSRDLETALAHLSN